MQNTLPSRLEKFIGIWIFISVMYLCWYFFTWTESMIPLYYVLWLGGVGIPIWIYRNALAMRLRRGRSLALRYFFLAFGMVLLEEIFAAFVMHLSEGFSFSLYLVRVGQFWTLNLLAFTGLIVGWHVLLKRYVYTTREAFYLIALWGLYAEHIIWRLFFDPASFVFFALPTMYGYGLIMVPSLLSRQDKGKEVSRRKKYLLAFVIPFLFSLPTILLLGFLRLQFPGAFPPCELIAC